MEGLGGAGLRIRLLNGFAVERNGETIPNDSWERPTAKTLVKLLALEPSHRLHRDQILDLLWPEHDLHAGLSAFRKALSWARSALEPERQGHGSSLYLQAGDEVVALKRVSIDVDEFERAAMSAIAQGNPQAMSRALDLYVGPLLPEDRYADWAAERRGRVEDLYDRLVLAYAQAYGAEGHYGAAIEQLCGVLQRDPLRETVHREIMRLSLAAGSPQQAVEQFKRLREALKEDGAEPSEESGALYETALSLITVPSPPGSPTSLPPGAARHLAGPPLAGRERMLSVLTSALTRLREGTGGVLLISGEAGVGKTRLAAELGRQAADGEPWFSGDRATSRRE